MAIFSLVPPPEYASLHNTSNNFDSLSLNAIQLLCAAMSEADIDLALEAADSAFKSLRAQAATLGPVEKMSFLAA